MSWLFQQLFLFFYRFILFTITHHCFPPTLKLRRTNPPTLSSFEATEGKPSYAKATEGKEKTPQSLAGSVFQPIRCINY